LPGGLTTGTCGYAINDLSVEAVWYLAELRREMWWAFALVWCGWVMSAETFMKHIEAWADFVMCATAAWFNPDLPIQIAQYFRDNQISR
jgi:dihydroorotate dehydrogenase